MKRTFLQFGSAFVLSIGATMPLHANSPTDGTCDQGCPSCEEGNCEAQDSTYGSSQSYSTENNTTSEGTECTAEVANSFDTGGQQQSTPNRPGITANNFKREVLVFKGVGANYIKYQDVDGVRKPLQMPTKKSTLQFSDLPVGENGYQIAEYLNAGLPAPGSNGVRSIPANAQPTVITIYRQAKDGSGNPLEGVMDVVHKKRHPQSGLWVTKTTRFECNKTSNDWSRKFYLGDPADSGAPNPYRVVSVTRTPDPLDPTARETVREVIEEQCTDGSSTSMVKVKDQTIQYAFYKFGEPVVLQQTSHTGLGSSSELTESWTYYTNAADRASFNKQKTLRRNDGQWANYTYSGSPVTGVLVTKTVSGWLDNVAPAIDTTPDEGANRVVTRIEAKNETATFGEEEKIQGVLVSKSWGERYKDNAGQLVTKSRVETGTSTLLTVRTNYAKDESVTEAERGKVKSIEFPDGRVELHRYAQSGTNVVETREKGAGNANGVTAGTRTISTYTASGNELIKEIEVDIASGAELSVREAISFDSNGKPTRWAYNNNPDDYSETIRGCCGIESERSRDGIVTTYTRDALMRPTASVSLGITTTYTYDKKTIGGETFPKVKMVKAAGGLTQLMGSVVSDHAGNVIERISPDLDGDSNEEVTTIVRNVTSRTTTTTNPDDGDVVEVNYADGQSKSRSGTAVAPAAWTYATHGEQGGGLVTTSYAGNSSSIRWTKTYKNLADNALKTTAPGGSGEIAIQVNTFDAVGRITATADGDGVTTLYAYNAEGARYRTALDLNQNNQIDNADRVTDAIEDVVAESPIGVSHRTHKVIYDLSNQPVMTSTTLQSVDGLSTRTEVLGGGATTSVVEPWTERLDGAWNATTTLPDGTKSVTAYTSWQATGQFRLDTTNSAIESSTVGYNALGQAITQNDSRKTTMTVRTAYDSAGQVTSVTEDLTTGTDRVMGYIYDSMGRMKATTMPDSTVKHVSYWPTGQVKAEWGSQTYPTVKLYSPQGELEELRTWRNNAPTTPDETSEHFDKTTWSYNNRGQMSGKLYADNKGPSYTYTVGGRLHTRTWARGVVTTYGYNAAGELTSKNYSDSTPDVVIGYDKLGRQTSVSNGVAQSIFAHDATTLRLDTETVSYNVDGSPGFELSRILDRSNDSLGRDSGWQLKDGMTIENEAAYGYHAATGRLATVAGLGGTFTYGYVPGSNLIASVAGPAHTVTNTWLPDRDALQLKENKVGTTVVSSFDYEVNAIGQRTGVTSASDLSATSTVLWGYDGLGQVVSADSSEAGHDRSYLFDTIGNRKKSADSLTISSGIDYLANNLNQYTTIASLTPVYDDDGNATSYPLPVAPSMNATLEWDGENRMKSSTTAGVTTIYMYDAQSRRVAIISGSNISLELYDGWNCIARYAGGLLSKRYLWGMDLSGSMYGAGGVGGLLLVGEGSEIHYPTFDGNGNVSEYLRSNGNEAAHFEYDPFGRTMINTDASGLFNVRFSTKQCDETGLLYYGHRYFDPQFGKWLSRDPLEELGGENLNAFVKNNGIDTVDIDGLIPFSRRPGPRKPPRPNPEDPVILNNLNGFGNWLVGALSHINVDWSSFDPTGTTRDSLVTTFKLSILQRVIQECAKLKPKQMKQLSLFSHTSVPAASPVPWISNYTAHVDGNVGVNTIITKSEGSNGKCLCISETKVVLRADDVSDFNPGGQIPVFGGAVNIPDDWFISLRDNTPLGHDYTISASEERSVNIRIEK